MNLYLITRNDYIGEDQYDSAVVAAPDEETAKMFIKKNINDWTNTIFTHVDHVTKVSHTDLDITVEYIGTAKDDLPAGTVIASFNAGSW